MSRIKVLTILAVIVLVAAADCVLAQTWNGAGGRVWTQPDSDDFSPEYTSGSTATFTTTGNGTVTNDAGGVTPGAFVVESGTYTFTGGSIGGTGSVTKSGSGSLTILSANSFSGGVFINGGSIILNTGSTSASLGDPANVVTFNSNSTFNVQAVNQTLSQGFAVNEGVTATLTANADRTLTINNAVTGSGSLNTSSGGSNWRVYLNSTANTISGNIGVGVGGNAHGKEIYMNSLTDSAGSRLRIGFSTWEARFYYGVGAIAPLVLSQRQIELTGTTGAVSFNNNAANANCTVTINTDLLITGDGNKTFTLGGTHTGNNTFAGAITDGTNSVISLTKAGTGKWILSGNNTYSGITTVSAGTLALRNDNSLPRAGTLNRTGTSSIDIEGRAQVAVLQATGVSFPSGIYGSTSSGAQYSGAQLTTVNDTLIDNFFTGTGVLFVGTPYPPSGTVLIIK